MSVRLRRRAWAAAGLLAALTPLVTAPPTVAAADASSGAPAGTSSAASSAAARDYVVQIQDSHREQVLAALARLGVPADAEFRTVLDGFAVTLTDTQARTLAASPGVVRVQPDRTLTLLGTQVLPPWNLDRVDQPTAAVDGAYTYPDSAGQGVRVYVVDTGVTAVAGQFTGRLLPGFTAVDDGRGSSDCHGHGTHVAGIAASTGYGAAKKATVVPVRVLDCAGAGSTTTVIAGLNWIAASHPSGVPGVVNLSLGGPKDPLIDAAVNALVTRGLLVVVAAGNSATDACTASPSGAVSALTVGATGLGDDRAPYSNYGPCVDLFAPGSTVPSVDVSGGPAPAVMSGTSMAAPLVAGIAALYLAEHPGALPAASSAALLAASTDCVAGAGTATTTRLVNLKALYPYPSPQPPRNLTSMIGADNVLHLSWDAPANAERAPVTDYRIEIQMRSSGGYGTYDDGVSDRTAASFTFLQPGATYDFRITALSAGIVGDSASPLTVTIPQPAPPRPQPVVKPGQPLKVHAIRRTRSTLTVLWQPPTRHGTAALRDYRVQISRDGVTWKSVRDGVSTRTWVRIRGLRAHTRYRVRVAAITAVGSGKWTPPASLRTL